MLTLGFPSSTLTFSLNSLATSVLIYITTLSSQGCCYYVFFSSLFIFVESIYFSSSSTLPFFRSFWDKSCLLSFSGCLRFDVLTNSIFFWLADLVSFSYLFFARVDLVFLTLFLSTLAGFLDFLFETSFCLVADFSKLTFYSSTETSLFVADISLDMGRASSEIVCRIFFDLWIRLF